MNYIATLITDDGRVSSDLDHKAAMLWQSFKDGLGTSLGTNMQFDFTSSNTNNLGHLEDDFTIKEIYEVINCMPNDKSPGPDGFNGLFMKKCWHIVKEQFYKFCFDFQNECVDISPINTAFIALIPKKDSPENPNDYRPICLVIMPIKILTKMLANRLQQHIIPLISKNQYGFIKSKTIQDWLAWCFEYLKICHKSKKEIIILKIGLEKAFDKIEHSAIIYMLRHLGFGEKWIRWISKILSTASTYVVLNGVPCKTIKCKRGVRQGDPLSPLLFVLAAEMLQIAVNDAWHNGLIELPIEQSFGLSYPIIQYVDDTLIIMPADSQQLQNLMTMLQKFSASTGLQVNYHKSSLVLINISNERANELAAILNYKRECMPFTYRGLPMVTTRPKVDDLMPMVSRLDKRLSGIATMMSYPGRLIRLKKQLFLHYPYLLCAPSKSHLPFWTILRKKEGPSYAMVRT